MTCSISSTKPCTWLAWGRIRSKSIKQHNEKYCWNSSITDRRWIWSSKHRNSWRPHKWICIPWILTTIGIRSTWINRGTRMACWKLQDRRPVYPRIQLKHHFSWKRGEHCVVLSLQICSCWQHVLSTSCSLVMKQDDGLFICRCKSQTTRCDEAPPWEFCMFALTNGYLVMRKVCDYHEKGVDIAIRTYYYSWPFALIRTV